MKKNLIVKITLGALLCAGIIPAAASTHNNILQLNKTNAALQPHQQVTDMGYRVKTKDGGGEEVSILIKDTENTSKVDMRVLDVKQNVVRNWVGIRKSEGAQGWSLKPVNGTTVGTGDSIDVQLRDHFDHKKTSYIVNGQIDYE